MKISKWSFVGYIVGITFALSSAIRYYILYPDLDKALVYVLIGAIICSVSWLYNKQLEHGNEITAMEDFLSEQSIKFNGGVKYGN